MVAYKKISCYQLVILLLATIGHAFGEASKGPLVEKII